MDLFLGCSISMFNLNLNIVLEVRYSIFDLPNFKIICRVFDVRSNLECTNSLSWKFLFGRLFKLEDPHLKPGQLYFRHEHLFFKPEHMYFVLEHFYCETEHFYCARTPLF